MSAASASIANAATSISPAAIPALVRTSLNPNSPIRMASRYALSVDSANTALAAATSRLRVTSAVAARTKAAMNCTRNSQPIVGIDRYPVRYRSRWMLADPASSTAPASGSHSCAQLPVSSRRCLPTTRTPSPRPAAFRLAVTHYAPRPAPVHQPACQVGWRRGASSGNRRG